MNVTALQSSAFPADGQIPTKYTCDGDNISPPLTIGDPPSGVQYLAIIFDDPEAVSGTFDHWVIWDIPAGSMIEENTLAGITGKNSKGTTGYTGPCPPNGEHRYHFRVFGYAAPLALSAGATKNEVLLQLDGHALFSAELFGRYGANR